jgi:type VI secretion system protein ImpB
MDGKNGAEELLAKLLADPALLKSLSTSVKPVESTSPEGE